MRNLFAIVLSLVMFAETGTAQDRYPIGIGRLFTNDILGDGDDRWRSGSYVISYLRGREMYDGGAAAFGDVLEYRLRAEIISPDAESSAPGDRPYVGAMSFGLHTHFGSGRMHYSLGADVVALGPQTGLSRFQEAYHDAFDLPEPAYSDAQLANDLLIAGSASASGVYVVGDRVTLRPFVEARVGVEEIARIGGDVVIGGALRDDLMLRDEVTGQLYAGTSGAVDGMALVFGADAAIVGDSAYLPAVRGAIARDRRARARAGLHYQAADGPSLFYGLTYLTPEFEGQSGGQILGSLKLNFNF